MNMKKLGLLAALALASTATFADVSVRLRGGYTTGDYELSYNDESSYTAEYTGVPIGATLILDSGLYFDLLIANVSGDADVLDQTTDFERDDKTLTAGWRMDNVSFYVGYKTAETNTDYPFGIPPDKFESSGLVAGAGVAFPSGNHSFAISGGLGFMEGTYTPEPGVDFDADFTLGYSFGLSYSYSFNSHFAITADYKWQSYDFEFTDSAETLTEDFSGFSVLAGYRF